MILRTHSIVVLIAFTIAGASLLQLTGREEHAIVLNDGWRFYPNQFVSPANVFSVPGAVPIDVPGSWGVGMRYPALGKGTYVAAVVLDKPLHNGALHFPVVNSACKAFINGRLVEQLGRIGDDYEPELRRMTMALPQEDSLVIVVQVENRSYFRGGIVRAPVIDSMSRLIADTGKQAAIQNFLIGCLFAMAMYQSIMFCYHRQTRSFLYLSLLCLAVAIRAAVTLHGSYFLPSLFPTVPVEIWRKMEFFFVYGTVLLLPLYVRSIFPSFAPYWPLLFFFPLACFLCAQVLIGAQPYYGQYLDFFHLSFVVVIIYMLCSTVRATRKGDPQAKVLRWGIYVSLPLVLLEAMQNSKAMGLNFGIPFLAEAGLLSFLHFQVVLVANQFRNSLSALRDLNQNLEKKVDQRTNELSHANRIKDRLLSLISHDIKSPLHSLKSLVSLFHQKEISPKEFGRLMEHLGGELEKTTLLVDNLLSWTAGQLKGLSVKKETFDLKAVVESTVQLFHSFILQKHIALHHNMVAPIVITSDRNILSTVVRNIVANAVKFTDHYGRIDIAVSANQQQLTIEISDNGIGMDEVTLQSLSNPMITVVNSGTSNEKGTGLGIMLCRELIKKLNGDLVMESRRNVGSRFTIVVPLALEP